MFLLSVFVIDFFVIVAAKIFFICYPSTTFSDSVEREFETYTELFFLVAYYGVVLNFNLSERCRNL